MTTASMHATAPRADRRRRRIALIIALGVLATTACGDGGTDADVDPTATQEPADASGDDESAAADDVDLEDASGTDEAGQESDTGGEVGIVPANGSVTVDGDDLALDRAMRCPPRELIEGDGEVELRTFAYGPDDAYSVDVWEMVEDGVSSHRVVSDAPGIYGSRSEHHAEEGADDYPLFEIDGDRISIRVQLTGEDTEPVEVLAEWDLPIDTLPEQRC